MQALRTVSSRTSAHKNISLARWRHPTTLSKKCQVTPPFRVLKLLTGVPTPILCLVVQPWPTLCDPMDCNLPGSSVHGDSPSKNTGVGCHALLQGIFPTQGLNPGLLRCGRILYHLSHQGSPRNLEWVAYPFSKGACWSRNRIRRILYQLSYQGSPYLFLGDFYMTNITYKILFIFGYTGSSLLCGLFSSCEWRLLIALASLVVKHMCFSSCDISALEHRLNSVAHGLSSSMACGTFLAQGWNPCLLQWQVDSLTLSHQGSSRTKIFLSLFSSNKFKNIYNKEINPIFYPDHSSRI